MSENSSCDVIKNSRTTVIIVFVLDDVFNLFYFVVDTVMVLTDLRCFCYCCDDVVI